MSRSSTTTTCVRRKEPRLESAKPKVRVKKAAPKPRRKRRILWVVTGVFLAQTVPPMLGDIGESGQQFLARYETGGMVVLYKEEDFLTTLERASLLEVKKWQKGKS